MIISPSSVISDLVPIVRIVQIICYKLWINIPMLGEVTSLAGGGREGFKDGFGKEARFNYPEGLYFDTDSNLLYVAEFVSINKETLM